jgi:uncharacterized protein (DUF885 family)
MRRRMTSVIAAGALHGCGTTAEPGVVEPAPVPSRTEVSAEIEESLATALAEAIQGVDAPGLQAALRRHWEAHLRRAPVEATRLGVHAFDDRVADQSPAAIAAKAELDRALLAEANAIDPATLSARDRITRQIFVEDLEIAIAGEVCRFHEWSVSAAENPVSEWNLLPEIHQVRTPADGAALLARYRQIPGAIDRTIANLRAGLAAGRVANAASVQRVIAMVEGQLASEPGSWSLLAPLRAERPDWPKDQVEAMRAGEAVVLGEIRPAVERYAAALKTEVLPRARGADRVGVMHVPDGAACYASQIRRHTSLASAPADIHATGMAEIGRINAEMQGLGEKLLGTRELPEILRRLRGDPLLHFATAEEVVAAAEAGLAAAREAMPRYFGVMPRADCVVRVVPAYEAPYTTVGYYRQPIPDGSKPGEYFINTFEPTTRPRYEARVLAIHEAIPGHHLQLAVSQELAAIPAFRKHAEQTVFVEGWALYSEHLAHEMGLFASDLDRMGGLSFAAWRASRLVVDTGLHALGWTREQAEQFLLEHTALSPENIRNEVDRYIGWPGQALAYKTGELELLRLRREAEAQLGPRFELKRFHDAVLQGGSVPLTVLRAQVDEFVRGSGGVR